MFNQTQIKRFLKDNDIRPKKEFGQNFLIDKNINDKIINYLNPTTEDIVIEIGAGFGNLTIPIAQSSYKIYAIEKDKRIARVLRDNLSGLNNVEVIEGDFLKLDLNNILLKKDSKKVKIVGNLPYYISSPIIFHLLDYRNKIDYILFSLQKEVAARLTSQPHSKDYGILSCLVNMYAECKSLVDIKRNSFYPQPKVDSSLVSLRFLESPRYEIVDEEGFRQVIKAAFSKRRKQILNALSSYRGFGLSKDIAKGILDELNIDVRRRAEDISLKDFARLANTISKRL